MQAMQGPRAQAIAGMSSGFKTATTPRPILQIRPQQPCIARHNSQPAGFSTSA